MKMMELVCNIPNELYKKWEASRFTLAEAVEFVDCVMNGIPLPKHHGDLVDRNSFEYLKTLHDAIHGKMSWSDALHKIRYSAPTIIPATRGEENGSCN